jgi:hypothetical protein
MNVILLRHYKDERVERTITPFDTIELALINLYGNMRASVGDTNCVKVTCELMDDDGNVTKCDRYMRNVEPVVETTSEE